MPTTDIKNKLRSVSGGKLLDANLIEETDDAKVFKATERVAVAALAASAKDWSIMVPTITTGKYIKTSDGSQVTNGGYDFAEVVLDGSETIRLSARVGNNDPAVAAFLDAGGNFIPGTAIAGPAASPRKYNYFPVTVPSAARKMRVSILTGTGSTLKIEKQIAAARINEGGAAGATLSRYETVSPPITTGKYIDASGVIQNDATYCYAELALDGSERGIAIKVKQQLATVCYLAWYDAQETFIPGGSLTGTSGGSQLPDTVVTPPDGGRLMRVCGKTSGITDIKLLKVATSVSDRLDAAAASAAAAKATLLAWQGPLGIASAAGRYIAADGSINTAASYTYQEYTLTGTENAFRVTATATNSGVSYAAWYDAGGNLIPGSALVGAGSATLHPAELITKPTGAAVLRVTSYQTTPLIEAQDVLPAVGDKVVANTASAAAALVAAQGYASLPLTAVTGKYIQLSDGSIQTASGWTYYEAAIPAGLAGAASLRASGIAYLTNVAFVAYYNGSSYLSGVGGTSTKTQNVDTVVAIPANATKVRLTVNDPGFVDIQVPTTTTGVPDRVAALEPQRAPTAYSYDYVSGTAIATLTSDVDYMILIVGTSWSAGFNSDAGDTPVSGSAVDPGNALMFDVGVYPNGRAVAAYTDLLEQVYVGTKETPASGIATAILTALNSRLGFKPRLIMAVGGKVGNAYAGGASAGTGNKRGSDAYKECLRIVSRAKNISAAAGRKLKVLVIVNLSGENEKAVYPYGNERQFIDALRQGRFNFDHDIRALTGQREAVPMVTYQTAWTDTSTFGKMSPIQSAQLKIHDRDPLIFQAGPVYYVEEDAAKSGHTLAVWTRRMGRQFGKAILEGILGPYFVPLQVIDSWWTSTTTFRLKYPEALALESSDTNIVLSTLANPAGKGIEFDDGSGSPPAITGVAIVTVSGTASIASGIMTMASPSGPVFDNMTVSGSGVTAGTRIVRQVSATTWQVSPSQTVASTTITLTADDTLEVTLASAPTGVRKRALIASRYQNGGGVLGKTKGGRSGIRSAASIDTDPLDGFVSYKWAMAEEVKL